MYLERSFRIDTLGILIATAIVGQTFVDVTTNDAVAGESFATTAFITTFCVVTFRIDVTAECSQQTFVIVCATRAVVFDGIALLTAALVRSQSVIAFTILTNASCRALVNIWTTNK